MRNKHKFSNPKWNEGQLRHLIDDLQALRRHMVTIRAGFGRSVSELRGGRRRSANNFVHHLALRGPVASNLRKRLQSVGIFLPEASDHVIADVDRALKIVKCLAALSNSPIAPGWDSHSFKNPKKPIKRRTQALLGDKPEERTVRIMVTVPTEAAYEPNYIYELVEHGMDCMRINCAHDNAEIWSRMISNLHHARSRTGRQCRILMDIPGPKLRTGPIESGPQVLKIHPHRDDFGEVTAPARVWITSVENTDLAPSCADASLAVRGEWLAKAIPGDTIYFQDARGSSRSLRIAGAEGRNRWAESMRTAYIVPKTELHLSGRNGDTAMDVTTTVKNIPQREQSVHLRLGDTLIVTAASIPGRQAKYGDEGRILRPASIGITCPDVFADVRPGEAIWFDDGRIGGIVRSIQPDQMTVEITHARVKGENLGADKGVNLPDSELKLPPLMAKDLEVLDFIVERADMVGYSFVRSRKDLNELQRRLHSVGGGKLGIVLKIETRKAFERLPELLLASIRRGRTGVMIARGDLAVECGFEKLAQSQEQILSLSQAAHIPVIWATQVLENLTKRGMASRAEITDAAMASRAQCVMLNKGPYIVPAIKTLDHLLRQAEACPMSTGAMPPYWDAAPAERSGLYLVKSAKSETPADSEQTTVNTVTGESQVVRAAMASAS